MRTPFAPAFIDRWIDCFIAFLLARRRSTSRRIPMSSLRRAVYSLSAYHFAVQVRETPRRKPYGWTFLPMSGLPIRNDDRDVGHRLVDRKHPTLGPRPPALDRRALVGRGVGDDQVFGRQVVVVLRVGGRALQDALDVTGGVLRHEPEQGGGLLDGATADRGDDEVGLAGRPAEVLGGCGHAHVVGSYFSAVDRSVCLPCPR